VDPADRQFLADQVALVARQGKVLLVQDYIGKTVAMEVEVALVLVPDRRNLQPGVRFSIRDSAIPT